MKRVIASVLIGIVLSLFITLIGVATLALIAKGQSGNAVITIGAIVIKTASIFSGTIFSVLGVRKKGALCGMCNGLAYCLCCGGISALLLQRSFGENIIVSVLSDGAIGIISGIICVNLISK